MKKTSTALHFTNAQKEKTRKRISIILCILMLLGTLVFVSCATTSTNNSSSTSNQQQHVHTYGNWVITKDPTCIETGIQTQSCSCGDTKSQNIPALDQHVGTGRCSACGLDYYDALVKYISQNGTAKTNYGNEVVRYIIDYKIGNNVYDVAYHIAEDIIEIRHYVSTEELKTARLIIYKGNMEYGDYSWSYYISTKRIGGAIDATTITPNAAVTLAINSSTISSGEGSALNTAQRSLKGIINEAFPQFLKDSQTNISMSNIGFERFK